MPLLQPVASADHRSRRLNRLKPIPAKPEPPAPRPGSPPPLNPRHGTDPRAWEAALEGIAQIALCLAMVLAGCQGPNANAELVRAEPRWRVLRPQHQQRLGQSFKILRWDLSPDHRRPLQCGCSPPAADHLVPTRSKMGRAILDGPLFCFQRPFRGLRRRKFTSLSNS